MKKLLIFLFAIPALFGQNALQLELSDLNFRNGKILISVNSAEKFTIFRLEANGDQIPLINKAAPPEKANTGHWAREGEQIIVHVNSAENIKSIVIWCITDSKSVIQEKEYILEYSDGTIKTSKYLVRNITEGTGR